MNSQYHCIALPGILFLLFFFAGVDAQDSTIRQKIPVPAGYARIEYPAGSYSGWIQSLPVKGDKTIAMHDGNTVGTLANLSYFHYNVFAVVKMPLLFTADLEQCADFAMRFWAEYHRQTNRLDRLYLFNYSGQRQMFAASGLTFAKFARRAFANSNSFSLKKGCAAVEDSALAPGDMFVQNRSGGIGHVSVIMDACASDKGEKLFLVGYSFMPAQEFHIEKARDEYGRGGWFTLLGYKRYLADNLDFGEPVLRRFKPL
jgi:hypothetical protein